jgi:5-methylthioribose kinase
MVLRVDVDDRPAFVLKQARKKLRVAMDWQARLERAWAEAAAMRVLGEILPVGLVPALLFEDREDFLFAMTFAGTEATTWKSHLMSGRTDAGLARSIGSTLAMVHTRGAGHPDLRGLLADTSLFDELRIDPYYRTIIRVYPHISNAIETLIAGMKTAEPEPTLVLGDYSPKNILINNHNIILLDFECAHAGDAAFDLGFCLSHLLLKLVRSAGDSRYLAMASSFLGGYQEECEPRLGAQRLQARMARGLRHGGACLLARLDGKSPVEYLDELPIPTVRDFAMAVLLDESGDSLSETLFEKLAATARMSMHYRHSH